MVSLYKVGLTIDRINKNGGYSPENCEWVTRKENSSRQSRVRVSEDSVTSLLLALTDICSEFRSELFIDVYRGKILGDCLMDETKRWLKERGVEVVK